MNSLAKSLFLALTAFAVAGLFVLGSPAKQASADDELSIEKVCDGVDGTFTLLVDLDLEANVQVAGDITVDAVLGPVVLTIEPADADISDIVQALLDELLPLQIQVGCGDTVDDVLSAVLGAVGQLTISVEDLAALISLNLDSLGLTGEQLAALLGLDVVLFDGGTLADLDSELNAGIEIEDQCVTVLLVDICVDLIISGDIDVTATITEPGGDPAFGEACPEGLVSLDFDEEGVAVCVLTNTSEQVMPSLTIQKSCEGDTPPEGPFTVSVDGGDALPIDCDGELLVANILPGASVTVTETDAGDAAFQAIDCGEAGFAEGSEITVTIEEDVTCTIINSSDEITPPDDDDDDDDGDGDGDGDGDDDGDGAGDGGLNIDTDNTNTNVIGIDNSNTNTNANNNENENENENTNINENNNTNTNTQNQENTQNQSNENTQTNNIEASPVINIKID